MTLQAVMRTPSMTAPSPRRLARLGQLARLGLPRASLLLQTWLRTLLACTAGRWALLPAQSRRTFCQRLTGIT